MTLRLAHVAIVVRSIEAASRLYGPVLDGEVGEPEEVVGQGVRVAFVPVGDARIELVEPVNPAGPAGRFLAARGEGVHHVAFYVPDLGAALARARAAGYELVESPTAGAEGRTVAFLHPKSAHGALVELIQA